MNILGRLPLPPGNGWNGGREHGFAVAQTEAPPVVALSPGKCGFTIVGTNAPFEGMFRDVF